MQDHLNFRTGRTLFLVYKLVKVSPKAGSDARGKTISRWLELKSYLARGDCYGEESCRAIFCNLLQPLGKYVTLTSYSTSVDCGSLGV